MNYYDKTAGTPRVAIIGAGFAGLWAAKQLKDSDADVVVIDKNNFHTFIPLLYQVGAAEISPESIAYPLRNILRKYPNIQFVMDEVTDIDFEQKEIAGRSTVVPYDYAILAVGSQTNFFGVPGGREHAFELKSLDHGVELRNHILNCFERASFERDPEKRDRILNFAVVGGGPTGVEYAAALAELVQAMKEKDFPRIDKREISVILLEMTGSVLGFMPEKLQKYTNERLTELGVDVRLNAAVSKITTTEVYVGDDLTIPTETVIWTAGVRGDVIAEKLGLPVMKSGQVPVSDSLEVKERQGLYVAGDLAYFEQGGGPLPMMAPVAMQQGIHAAKNILRTIRNQPQEPFRYKDNGSMVVIGRNNAVVNAFNLAFTGFFAWLTWLTVHLMKLVGFRDRISVLLDWAWNYITFDRTIKLILPTRRRGSNAAKSEEAIRIDEEEPAGEEVR